MSLLGRHLSLVNFLPPTIKFTLPTRNGKSWDGAHGQCPSFAFLCSLDLKSPLILCESKPPDSLHFSLAGRLRMHVIAWHQVENVLLSHFIMPASWEGDDCPFSCSARLAPSTFSFWRKFVAFYTAWFPTATHIQIIIDYDHQWIVHLHYTQTTYTTYSIH